MAESGEDYNPGVWKGWNYDDARKKHVDPTVGRGYSLQSQINKLPDNLKPSKGTVEEVPAKLTTDAKAPLVVVIDGTGSMGTFHEVIFKKLPLLDDGVKDYLEDCEISYAVVGDAATDKLPLQIQPFSKGKDMIETLNKLQLEAGGGSNKVESYDLAALYYARNVEMPKAVKPIIVFICDEGVYDKVNVSWAKDFAKVSIDAQIKRQDLFEELAKKYSVYVVRTHCKYLGEYLKGDEMVGANKTIHEQWVKLVGQDHIALLEDPRRVVDVMLGLLANETNKMDFFTKEINDRQEPDQVKSVMKAMSSVAKETPSSDQSLSVTKSKKTTNKKSDSLL